MFATFCSMLVIYLNGISFHSGPPIVEQARNTIVFDAWMTSERRIRPLTSLRSLIAIPAFSWKSQSALDQSFRANWLVIAGAMMVLALMSSRSALAQDPRIPGQGFQHAAYAPLPIPPSPGTIFTDTPPQEIAPLMSAPTGHASGYPRQMPWGNGHIMIADPADFPRVKAFDVHSPGSLWNNMRPNLFGIESSDEWDFYNLINTDRPDFTDATYSVGKGVTILESGYTYRKSEDSELHLDRRQLPETLLRVGVTDELEIRFKYVGYVMTSISDQTTGLKTSAFGNDDLQVSIKYEVLQQDDWRPMVTFLGGTTIPSGTGGISAYQTQPFANVVLGWGFRRWLYLKLSTGVDFVKTNDVTKVVEGSLQEGPLGLNQVDNITQWHQSASLLFQATKRVGGFVEWFSFFSNNSGDNRASNFVDTGLFIYLTPNIQADVRIGERISDRVNSVFTGAGLSLRF
ncbi:MAG: transporter [Planctomycetota bacterium]